MEDAIKTMDIAEEVLRLSPDQIKERLEALDKAVAADVLRKAILRLRAIRAEQEHLDTDIEKIEYHAHRLEEILLGVQTPKSARGDDPLGLLEEFDESS